MNSALAPVGVFGGTFDPVHYGHLRSALELVEYLNLDHLRMMPCAVPAHRSAPSCSARERAAMVELAVASEPRLVCDPRELHRQGPSYTIDSLEELRREFGAARSLCLVMGCDALLGLDAWHRWQDLLNTAHIVVIARPGWQLPATGVVADWLAQHREESPQALHNRASGCVLVKELRPLAISSTEIRNVLGSAKSARYLLPESVIDYIEQRKLYTREEKHIEE